MIEWEGAPGELTRVPCFAVGKPEAQRGDGAHPEHMTGRAGQAWTPGHSFGLGRLYHTTGMVEPSPGEGTHFVLTVKQPVSKASP